MAPIALTPLDDQTAAEELLVEYLRRLAARPGARQALLVSLSRLPAASRRDAWLRAATEALGRLADGRRGELFVLANADLVFFFPAEAAAAVARAAGELRLVFGAGAAEAGRQELISWVDPHVELGRLLTLARGVQAAAARCPPSAHAEGRAAPPAGDGAAEPTPPRAALTPLLLDRLEAGLAQADLMSHLRRYAVCALARETLPQPRFVEYTVSIRDLAATMLPECDLARDRRLFQHLTEALDRRMLALVALPDGIGDDDVVSINLNVATVLSAAFFAFDEALIAARRGRIVIEFRLDDMVADLEAFAVAARLCRDRGYRLCLDGLGAAGFDLLDPLPDGFDFVKLACDGRLLADARANAPWLAAAVARAGSGRLILSHVETAAALAFGRGCGVVLFQGRHIDRLLAEARQRRHFRRLNRAPGRVT